MKCCVEYKEAFALFDKRGTGQVPRESLGELLRSLGQNPTQAEVGQLEQSIGASCEYDQGHHNRWNAKTSQSATTSSWVSSTDQTAGSQREQRVSSDTRNCFRDELIRTTDEFIKGFQVFDKAGNGFIGAGELRYVLTQLGEKMTDEEVDELLKGFPVQ